MAQWSAHHDPDTIVSTAMRKRLDNDWNGAIESLGALAHN
jgi:hypothetical protein